MQLRALLAQHLKAVTNIEILIAQRPDEVVIDLGPVTFLSPHGLSVLVRWAQKMERRRRWVMDMGQPSWVCVALGGPVGGRVARWRGAVCARSVEGLRSRR